MIKYDKIFLKGIKINTLVGIRKKERNNKQKICVNCIIKMYPLKKLKDGIRNTIDYTILQKDIKVFIQNSTYYLLETLSIKLSEFLLKKYKLIYILIKIEKLEVLKDIKKIGVIVERSI